MNGDRGEAGRGQGEGGGIRSKRRKIGIGDEAKKDTVKDPGVEGKSMGEADVGSDKEEEDAREVRVNVTNMPRR